MSQTIVVEAVSDKFKNKYNSGSVLAGGKWLQVAKALDISLFQKDSQIEVETKTNEKGYVSIVGVVQVEAVEQPKVKKTKTETTSAAKTVTVNNYEDNKNRRILVQGITQAVAQSPALASLPGITIEEISENIKALATDLIAFVDEQAK